MAVACDFLIVGGGVIGSSIAFHLAQRHMGSVLLVEKSFLGAGSSGKSGAIIRQHYSNRLTALMARKSLAVFQQFDGLVGAPPVFTHTAMVLIFNEKDQHHAGVREDRRATDEAVELLEDRQAFSG